MTLITHALDRVARQVSLDVPDSWLSATEKEYVEIRDDFLLETVEDIQERVDLPSPIGKEYELTGDGSETYDLPSDFKRLMRDPMAVYETTTVRRALMPITTDGEWRHIKSIGTTGAQRYYRTGGYDGAFTISIYREPASSITVFINYVSNLWVKYDSGGSAAYKAAFSDVEDVLLFPRRLVEAGVVARWRERYGVDPTDKLREYEALLAKLANDMRGRRFVNFGEPVIRRHPFDIPVPDQIPTS